MSPEVMPRLKRLIGFPRVSGDEPLERETDSAVEQFSPRERG